MYIHCKYDARTGVVNVLLRLALGLLLPAAPVLHMSRRCCHKHQNTCQQHCEAGFFHHFLFPVRPMWNSPHNGLTWTRLQFVYQVLPKRMGGIGSHPKALCARLVHKPYGIPIKRLKGKWLSDDFGLSKWNDRSKRRYIVRMPILTKSKPHGRGQGRCGLGSTPDLSTAYFMIETVGEVSGGYFILKISGLSWRIFHGLEPLGGVRREVHARWSKSSEEWVLNPALLLWVLKYESGTPPGGGHSYWRSRDRQGYLRRPVMMLGSLTGQDGSCPPPYRRARKNLIRALS